LKEKQDERKHFLRSLGERCVSPKKETQEAIYPLTLNRVLDVVTGAAAAVLRPI
jgi:hypothetical protein